MAKNKNLNQASRAKQDEFYTQLTDIENELRHYKDYFENKTVFCNCDDPYESAFFKYFVMHFNVFKLKKLIVTSYNGSPISGSELMINFDEDMKNLKPAYKVELTELKDWNNDTATGLDDVKYALDNKIIPVEKLKGSGDFRSPECIELLKESDIVVTNPPFSLFREYVAQLIEYDKKFIIIGNQNAITYKEIFPLFMNNKIWLGYGFRGSAGFKVPDYYEERANRFWIDENGQKWRSMGNTLWFTNLDIKKRHEEIFLYRNYTPEDYPKYDNYDAIEVSQTKNIPCDYFGVMGVPITFMDKYNPDQFELLGIDRYTVPPEALFSGRLAVNGKSKYARILIKRRQA